jgi:hypothetical protein
LKHIDGPVELGVTSVSKSFWINVHENVRLDLTGEFCTRGNVRETISVLLWIISPRRR